MTKTAAQSKGLVFTGAYERSKEKLRTELQKLKSKGYKAYLVTVPDSPLSRGCVGVGYSIYAEPKYSLDQTAAEMKKRIERHPEILKQIKQKYEEDVVAEETKTQNCLDWLKEHGY